MGYETKLKEQALYNLQDGSGLGGSFFLGSGVVDSNMQFSFYKINDDGSKELVTLKAKDVKVFDNSDKPYIVVVDGCNWGGSWFMPAICIQHREIREIHVPKNTIKDGFVLDAK